ncbi:hypothetical protein D3C73_1381210 [compost metagenome]
MNKVFTVSGFLDNISGRFIDGGEGDSRLDRTDRRFIGFQNGAVDSNLVFRELTQGEGSSDIGGVAACIYTDIKHDQVSTS